MNGKAGEDILSWRELGPSHQGRIKAVFPEEEKRGKEPLGKEEGGFRPRIFLYVEVGICPRPPLSSAQEGERT